MLKDPTCPLSILKTFLTDEIIVQYTNTYAYILQDPLYIEKLWSNRSLLNLWKDISTVDET